MVTPDNSDTIDLSRVFSQFVQLIIENLRLIILIVILCLAGGMLFYWLVPRKFESKMIIQSKVLTESYSIKLAENLHKHIDDHDVDYISSKLNLTPEEARLLLAFEIVSALSPNSQLIDEEEKIIIMVVVRVSDNAILPKLEEGIIQYLRSNEYVRRRVQENRKYLEGIIATYDREIKMMDSLKSKISKGIFPFSKDGDALIVDLGNLYEAAGDLNEKKYSAERSLAIAESVQVIEGFTPYEKQVWPKLSFVLITSVVVAGAIAALLLIVRMAHQERIKMIQKM